MMKCSHCGMEIPFAGKVCPFCGVDKTNDQKLHLVVMGTAFSTFIFTFALVGFLTQNPCLAVLAALAAVFFGTILALAVCTIAKWP